MNVNVNAKQPSLTINVKVHAEFKSPSWTRSLERLTLQAKGPGRTCVESPPMKLHDKTQSLTTATTAAASSIRLGSSKGAQTNQGSS